MSDKDENAINDGNLFHLSKYSDIIYDNIVYKMRIERSNFIQVPASLVFAAILEFWFQNFLGSPYIKSKLAPLLFNRIFYQNEK